MEKSRERGLEFRTFLKITFFLIEITILAKMQNNTVVRNAVPTAVHNWPPGHDSFDKPFDWLRTSSKKFSSSWIGNQKGPKQAPFDFWLPFVN
jgi:hypothetical protein